MEMEVKEKKLKEEGDVGGGLQAVSEEGRDFRGDEHVSILFSPF